MLRTDKDGETTCCTWYAVEAPDGSGAFFEFMSDALDAAKEWSEKFPEDFTFIHEICSTKTIKNGELT